MLRCRMNEQTEEKKNQFENMNQIENKNIEFWLTIKELPFVNRHFSTQHTTFMASGLKVL